MNLHNELAQQKLELKKLQEQIRAFEQGNWQLVNQQKQEEKEQVEDDIWKSYLNFLAWFNPSA